MNRNVICCGNIAFDLIQTRGRKENDIIFQAKPGGSVLNTAIHLARLGLNVTMFSKTGKDTLGDALVKILKEEKINTKYTFQDERIRTSIALARLDEKGDSQYNFYKTVGPETVFAKTNIPSSVFKRSRIFHTGSMYSYEDYSFDETLNFMKLAKKTDLFVTFDPNWRENRIKNKSLARTRISKLLDHVDLLKLGGTDTLGITGAKTLSGALSKLPANIIVTLGAKGSFFWDGKNKLHQDAFKVPVVDTIGAGDAFSAGLIFRYSLIGKETFWKHMKENLLFASAVSALVCSARGATEGLRDLEQVYDFIYHRAGFWGHYSSLRRNSPLFGFGR